MKRGKRKRRESQFRIGVVEEMADNIYSIKFILQSLGYEVSSFPPVGNYMEGLKDFDPHLVIVDMMIPDRGGYRAIAEIRSSGLRKVPTLAITADAMEGSENEVIRAGASDFLGKPYSVGELQGKLQKLMGSPDAFERAAEDHS